MELLQQALNLLGKIVVAGGSLYALIGLIQFGWGMKYSQGTEQRDAIQQIMGGLMVVAGAGLFTYITL